MGVARVALALIALEACAGAAGAAGDDYVAPAWIGTADAVRIATMQGEDAALEDAVQDEAALAYQDGASSCFDVTIRSAAAGDLALPRRGARCTSGEARADATVSNETVSVYDYDDSGGLQASPAEGTPADAFEDLELEPLEPGMIRIVERHGRLCCAIAPVETMHLDVGTAPFVWELD